MQRLFGCLIITLLVSVVHNAYAVDHGNLDEDRPLRLEDAYPIAHGEIAVEVGAGFSVQRRGPNTGVFPLELLYGAFPNFQLGVGTTFSTNPRDVEEQTKSGDLHVSGLYNFNQETLTLPAFGLKLTLNFPTGVGSSGTDVELKGLITKSFDRLSLHFNGAYEFLNGTRRREREGRYEFVFGASYPIGAPRYTRTMLVADLFTEQSVQRGDSNTIGAEFGFRHQLTSRTVLDTGVGTEFSGPPDRSPFFLRTGISVAF